MNRYNNNSYNRNRPLEVGSFRPESWEEREILAIAEAVGEEEVRYLKYVLDQHGYPVIAESWEEFQQLLDAGQQFRSPKRFLTYLIENRLPKNAKMNKRYEGS